MDEPTNTHDLAMQAIAGGLLRPQDVTGDPDQIGRYQILRKIGQGGQGTVYLGHDPAMDRKVAIKVLSGGLSTDDVQRFLRETKILARVRHPGVVEVYDAGVCQGWPYFVMAYAGSRTLANTRLARSEFLDVLEQVALACHALHDQGVVHRDLKPANILLGEQGPLISDFGIAKAQTSTRLTQTGVVIGTPRYMAPEQLEGKRAGPATDVYALGVILYEHLAGRAPFEDENLISLATRALEEEPTSPREYAPNLSPALEACVLAALAKDPADRIPTALALAKALRSIRSAHPLAERKRSLWHIVAVGAVTATLLLLPTLLWWALAPDPEPPTRSASMPPTEPPQLEAPPPLIESSSLDTLDASSLLDIPLPLDAPLRLGAEIDPLADLSKQLRHWEQRPRVTGRQLAWRELKELAKRLDTLLAHDLQEPHASRLRMLLARTLVHQGRFAEARRHLQHAQVHGALERAKLAWSEVWRALALGQDASTKTVRGLGDELGRAVKHANSAQEARILQALLGLVHRDGGDHSPLTALLHEFERQDTGRAAIYRGQAYVLRGQREQGFVAFSKATDRAGTTLPSLEGRLFATFGTDSRTSGWTVALEMLRSGPDHPVALRGLITIASQLAARRPAATDLSGAGPAEVLERCAALLRNQHGTSTALGWVRLHLAIHKIHRHEDARDQLRHALRDFKEDRGQPERLAGRAYAYLLLARKHGADAKAYRRHAREALDGLRADWPRHALVESLSTHFDHGH